MEYHSLYAYAILSHPNKCPVALQRGLVCMQNDGVWLPLITSLGVGVATYYTMSKNNQSISQTIQKVVPFVSQMSNNQNTEQLGPHGMS